MPECPKRTENFRLLLLMSAALIFILVEEKVFLRGIVGPEVLDAVINIALVLDFLQVFDYLKGATGTLGII
jgi:hypothetical protein